MLNVQSLGGSRKLFGRANITHNEAPILVRGVLVVVGRTYEYLHYILQVGM